MTEPPKPSALRLWMSYFCLGLLVLGVVIYTQRDPLSRMVDAHRVDHLVDEYKAQPTQSLANRLWRLLEDRAVDRPTGDRVLQALMPIEVEQRSAYRNDRPVVVYFRHLIAPSHRTSTDIRIDYMYQSKLEGDDGPGNGGSHGLFDENWHGLTFVRTGERKPGTYAGHIVITYTVQQSVNLPGKPIDLYEAELRHPITLTIAEPDQAERIELVNDPAIGNTLKATLKVARGTGETNWSGFGDGDYSISVPGPPHLSSGPLPIAVSFQAEFVDESGNVVALDRGEYFRRVAGEQFDGFYGNTPSWHSISRQTGTYTGKLRLTPDAKFAYTDPRIKRIWGEVIELPVTVEIKRRER